MQIPLRSATTPPVDADLGTSKKGGHNFSRNQNEQDTPLGAVEESSALRLRPFVSISLHAVIFGMSSFYVDNVGLVWHASKKYNVTESYTNAATEYPRYTPTRQCLEHTDRELNIYLRPSLHHYWIINKI